MALRSACAIVLLLGVVGCVETAASLDAACLEKHPGDIRCCDPGGHIDHGICCFAGFHAVVDVEHPDWKGCVIDEPLCLNVDPDAGACRDAGAAAR